MISFMGLKCLVYGAKMVKQAGFVEKSVIIGYEYNRCFKTGKTYPARGY